MTKTISAAIGLLLTVGSASAGITGDAIRINANTDTGQGTWHLNASALVMDPATGGLTWQADGNIVIRDASGAPIVTVANLSVTFVDDPVISLNFLATAAGVATHFTIMSGVLNFTPGLYTAGASASITTTDNDGDGALTVGNYGVNDTYEALCDGQVIGTSTQGLAVGIFGSIPSAGTIGPANYNASSMQAKWDFNVSANDSASGTSVYHKTLVPAPGSAALLGLGGLLAARRRRA